MANLCNQCGQLLPREDAHFCNSCGAGVSPNASSSPIPRRTQVIADQYSSPASGTGAESASARPALREQIAFAPSVSPGDAGDAPPWLSRLDRMSAPPVSRPRTQNFSPDTPPGVENLPPNTGHPSSPGASRVPQRELRIKVWEGEAEESSEVEDQPTVPVPSAFAGEKDGHSFSPAARREQSASDTARAGEEERGDADLPTRPLVAHLSVPEQVHAQRTSERRFPAQSYRRAIPPQSLPGQMRDQQQQGFSAPVSPNPGQPPIRQQSMIPAMPLSSPGFQQPIATGERAASPVSSRPARRKSKMRIVVVLVMLLVLLGGGLIYWLIAYQPFSVPAVTSTSLSFRNANLGITLQYPQGWTSRLDSAHQTASFFDANHVDQVTISVTSSNRSSATGYVSKEAAQLGLTAQKNLSPVTFAGTTWQRVQGTLLVSGATDTETLLVAQHGSHFYSIAQIAPAATYVDADGLFFSMFRATFQFL